MRKIDSGIHLRIRNAVLADALTRVLVKAGYRMVDRQSQAPGDILLSTDTDLEPDECSAYRTSGNPVVVLLTSRANSVRDGYEDAGAWCLEMGAAAADLCNAIDSAAGAAARSPGPP